MSARQPDQSQRQAVQGADEGDSWIDVSVPIRSGMVHWPTDPPVRVIKARDLDAGDDATVSRLDVGVHTGTHIDAPVHFLRGTSGVDRVPLASLIGPARVVHLPDATVISAEAVDALDISPGDRVLFKTRNSLRCWNDDQFVPDYTYVSLPAARRLVAARVRTVAVDYLSVGGGDDNPATHRELLGGGICIIEGLNLSAVTPGEYTLIALPLRIQGCDGSPARVLLRKRRPV